MYRDGGRNQGGGRICQFFQQGRCRYGDSCKFEHPGANGSQETSNRFASPASQQGNALGGRGRTPVNGKDQPLPFSLNKEHIVTDLKNERPTWPFSAYGPGRDAPRQLLGGFPLEQSPEEMRVLYYIAQASGNPQPAIQSEQELLAKVNEQIQQILNDIDGAVNYVLAGENEHPNRRDMCQVPASGSTTTAANSFSNPTSTSGGFGQPSGLGATATSQPAFGAPSFGKPASPFAGAAQPSAFGQPSLPEGTSAFGKPSLPGQGGAFGQLSVPSQTSAFGQPSAPGQGSAFGQPSAPRPTTAFGQPSAPSTTSAFGQPSAPGTTSAFGQPSAPGTTSAFGRPSAPVASGAFGQPSLPGQTSAFGQPSQPTSAFGQPTNPAPSPFAQAGPGSAFGQPSQSNQPSPFAQPVSSQPSSGFGQPSSVAGGTTAGAFGRPSTAFGQPSQPQSNNPFATKPAETQPTPSPFGQPAQTNSAFGQPSGAPAFAQPSQPTPSPFAQPAASSQPSTFGAPPPTTSQPTATITNGTGSTGTPDPSTYIQKGPNNSIRSFKNQPVSYIDRDPHYRRQDDRTQERIWFPEGPPGLNKYTEEPQAVYEAVGPTLKDAYDFLAQTGTFKDGMMPEFAPKREWVRFDL